MKRFFFLALMLCLLEVSTASAALIVDLRFSDNTKTKPAAAGIYTINAWAQVTGGANANPNDDGLQFLIGSVRSTQVSGGAVLGNGASGVTAATGAGLFSTSGSVGGANGTQQNVSLDGIFDWGTTSSAASGGIKFNSTFNSGLDAVFANSPGAVPGTNVNSIAGGWEYLIGSFTFTIDPSSVNASAAQGATTTLDWFKMTSSTIGQHSHRIDGATISTAATYAPSLAANGVSFTANAIPEPGTLALGGMVLAGLAGWKLRRRKA